MSDDRRDESAETASWWPEFVAAYGTISLRELARRFDTNPRRLRRAAQRSGLTQEPESLRSQLVRLGQEPDAALAESLGTTAEAIAGARRRRNIPPFQSEPVAEQPQPPPVAPPATPAGLPAPRTEPRVRKKRRFEPAPAVVVVRKGTRAQVIETQGPAPLAERPELPAAPAAPAPATAAAEPDPRPRRRIVKTEERPAVAPVEPEPAPRPRRRIHKKAPPVRIVFDRKTDTGVPPELVAPPETPQAPATVVVPAPPAPAPVPQAEPAPERPSSLWSATVQTGRATRDLYILAQDLVAAAARASQEGTVLSVQAVPTL